MSARRLPTAGTPIKVSDLACALSTPDAVRGFEAGLARAFGVRYAYCAGSGAAAMLYALKAMKGLSEKKEVVLPAYTAPVTVLPVLEAGLVPRLAEVSLTSFNSDAEDLLRAVGEETLAVVPTHMFGLPVDVPRLMAGLAGRAFVLEDAAQAMGTTLKGRHAGSMGDVGMLSFQRGKNLSTYSGGAALTDREDLAKGIEDACTKARPGALCSLAEAFKVAAVSAAVRPGVYGLFHGLISPYKSTELHTEFCQSAYTPFQAGVGFRLLGRMEQMAGDRHEKGMRLLHGLAGVDGLILPDVPEGARVAFAHFPVLVKDASRVAPAQEALLRTGMETSRLYLRPLHRIYDLGYGIEPDPFPGATYLAERLLLIPTHHYVALDDIDRAADVIKGAL